MRLGRRAVIASALVPAAVHAQGQLRIPERWYAVKVGDDAFTVEMPGIPDHKVLNDATARGTPFALHSYSLETGGNSYVAQTALFPEDIDYSQPRRLLQGMLDDRARQLAGGKWSTTDWREIAGAAAVEATGALSTGNQLRQLAAVKARRFVVLAFMAANARGAEADRFFKSLKIA
jgi:hypothetical protein